LERVLTQIDGAANVASMNATFANIAETVSEQPQTFDRTETATVTNSTPTTFSDLTSGDVLFVVKIYETDGTYSYTDTIYASDINTAYVLSTGDWLQIDNNNYYATQDQISLRMYYGDARFNRMDFLYPDGTLAFQMDEDGDPFDGVDSVLMLDISNFSIFEDILSGNRYFLPGLGAAGLDQVYNYTHTTGLITVSDQYFPPLAVIDGSISNIISGLANATAEVVTSAASATEFAMPTIDIGDISTTTLGAVNTGNIAVGVNSTVDEAMSSSTRAIQTSIGIIGGSADTGTMMLNLAHNTSAIQGNVNNTLIAVNGSVGNVNTTALGAVNTGTIANGVNAVVQGITGKSGVN
jgi:hypothetical protein